jgi:hypothetical protein
MWDGPGPTFEYRSRKVVALSTVDDIAKVLKEFDWHNYGLDLVEESESDDWAQNLAREICEDSGYVHAQMTSQLSCPNYVNKVGEWSPEESDPTGGEVDCGG